MMEMVMLMDFDGSFQWSTSPSLFRFDSKSHNGTSGGFLDHWKIVTRFYGFFAETTRD